MAKSPVNNMKIEISILRKNFLVMPKASMKIDYLSKDALK